MTRATLLATLLCIGCGSPTPRFAHVRRTEDPVVLERWTMGTRLRIVAFAREEVVAAALDEAGRLDALLSTFRLSSALSALNAAAGRRVAVPPELAQYLRSAVALAERTGGAFDPTVGPLVAASRSRDPGAIAAARALVGFRNVVFHGISEIELRLPGMAIDPGGIGKGWAVDAMVSRLRAAGVSAAFIDFGESSFYGMGAPPGRSGWAVRLRDAHGEPTGPDLILRDRSLSTSMSLALAEEPDRPSRPHIIDPRDGQLVMTPRIAAVVCPSGAEADALSTALVVLGQEGLAVLDRFPAASAWIHEEGRPPTARGELPLAPRPR
ncbi:MAG: FAD:protein FMN transferase [Deltaproteobacteria bacterium]|nr:FAD:protein FMN transferase [Deltaproteobacteria bacterium]